MNYSRPATWGGINIEGPEGGGGGRIPISQPKLWLNPIVPEHKSHLSGSPVQILFPFPFSIVFLLKGSEYTLSLLVIKI